MFEYCPVDRFQNTSLGESTGLVVWKDPTAVDNSGDDPTVTCSYLPRERFPIGRTEVGCQAVDKDHNSAKCTFIVTVFGKNACYSKHTFSS